MLLLLGFSRYLGLFILGVVDMKLKKHVLTKKLTLFILLKVKFFLTELFFLREPLYFLVFLFWLFTEH